MGLDPEIHLTERTTSQKLCGLGHITQFLMVSVSPSLNGGDQLQEEGQLPGFSRSWLWHHPVELPPWLCHQLLKAWTHPKALRASLSVSFCTADIVPQVRIYILATCVSHRGASVKGAA